MSSRVVTLKCKVPMKHDRQTEHLNVRLKGRSFEWDREQSRHRTLAPRISTTRKLSRNQKVIESTGLKGKRTVL